MGTFREGETKIRPGVYHRFENADKRISTGNEYVTPEPAPAVDHIEIRSLPTQTSFFVGEALDYTGVSIVAVMSDGGERDVTADCTFDPADGAIVAV